MEKACVNHCVGWLRFILDVDKKQNCNIVGSESSSQVFTHIDLSELGEGGAQYGRDSQHAVLHVG